MRGSAGGLLSRLTSCPGARLSRLPLMSSRGMLLCECDWASPLGLRFSLSLGASCLSLLLDLACGIGGCVV